MSEYGFCLIHEFLYKDKICNSVLKYENTGHKTPVFLRILLSVLYCLTLDFLLASI